MLVPNEEAVEPTGLKYTVSSKSSYRQNQAGQVLMLGMALLVVAGLTIIATFNTGRVVSDKVQLVNAADAAAYSAGVIVARQLNFLAYTNRAMMANHVAVAHMVSYTSWVRSVRDLRQNHSDVIDEIILLVPDLNLTYDAIDEILGPGGTGADNISPLYIALTQSLMYSQSLAQKITYDSLVNYDAAGGERALEVQAMELIAELHEMTFYQDPESIEAIDVNNLEHLNYIITRVAVQDQILLNTVQTEINEQDDLVRGFLSYDEAGDVDVIYAMAERSIDALASRDWFRDRSWDYGWIRRQGTTTQNNLGTSLNWVANDNYETIEATVVSNAGIGSADADVLCREANGINSFFRCDDGYTGFAQHFSINSALPGQPTLKLTTFLSKRIHNRFIDSASYDAGINQGAVGEDANDENNRVYISALARSEVFYERPCGKDGCVWGFGMYDGEQANLYNPFWQAHLSQ